MRSNNINLNTNLTPEYAGSIKFILDQIPAALDANTFVHGLVRERYYGKKESEK